MSVYFAQVGPYVKIGYSEKPFDRVESITRIGPRPDDVAKDAEARLLGWVPGDRARERAFHRLFADRWVASEWFRLDAGEVRDLIWADPRGVDVERMSAVAALVALEHPAATRAQLAEVGVQVEALDLDEALRGLLGPSPFAPPALANTG